MEMIRITERLTLYDKIELLHNEHEKVVNGKKMKKNMVTPSLEDAQIRDPLKAPLDHY
jgi:hypothetical protein